MSQELHIANFRYLLQLVEVYKPRLSFCRVSIKKKKDYCKITNCLTSSMLLHHTLLKLLNRKLSILNKQTE